jgi:hypothetical protein
MQKSSMGTDDLGGNLLHEMIFGGVAVLFAGGAAWGCRSLQPWGRGAEILGALILAIAVLFVAAAVPWLGIGSIIPGLLLCGLAIEGVKIWRQPMTDNFDRTTAVRLLLWLAGTAYLFRMMFNPRVFHYGFFQAPLAMVVGLATLLVALPDFVKLQGSGRKIYLVLLSVLMLWGSSRIAVVSANTLSAQTLPIGTDSDQFFGFDPRIPQAPSGVLMELSREYLAKDTGARSLLVLPEGVMLNYLTRLPSPIPYYMFDPDQFINHGTDILQRVAANPPDRIVLLTRNLQEYGVDRFGDSPPHGAALLDFIQHNYDPVYHEGNDPLRPDTAGLTVYALRADYTPPNRSTPPAP